MSIFKHLELPNGSTIPNRIAKAAMEENMANEYFAPSDAMIRLYETWSQGGSGLLITGNVMVDSRAMTGPGGVVLEDERQLAQFKRWAKAGRVNGNEIWMQINHPGRQMPAELDQETWAPSAVPVNLGSLSKHFNPPIEMTESMINEVIQRFIRTAELAEKAGFTGVEVHAAHGYLLSQFLSPLTNQRSDHWGGSLENRARLLLSIVTGIREAVSPRFTLAVKINSADFQRGGFELKDAKHVILLLNKLGVDLVELSGGSYEAPAMQGESRDEHTLAREAYFLDFAREISKVAEMPLMVTGGIRRYEVAESVIKSGIQMIGIATALAIEPNLPNKWKNGNLVIPQLRTIKWKNKPLASLAYMAMVKYQFDRQSKNRSSKPNVAPLKALIWNRLTNNCQVKRYKKKWLKLSQDYS